MPDLALWPQPTRAPVNVADAIYASGARTDGSDALAAFVAAEAAAFASGRALWLPKGPAPYVISAPFTPRVSVYSDGATIKKAATMADFAIVCSSPDVRLVNFIVDGNRQGGAGGGGIAWDGAAATGGGLSDIRARYCKADGIGAYNSAQLDCYATESSGHVSGDGISIGSGHGFVADTGGRLRQRSRCTANDNDGDGVRLLPAASDGCVVDCLANRNVGRGFNLRSDYGSLRNASGSYNNAFGVVFGVGNAAAPVTVTGWRVEWIAAEHTGAAFVNNDGGNVAKNGQGTNVQAYRLDDFEAAMIVSRSPEGYGVALTEESIGHVGCGDVTIATIITDQGGASELDPGVHISHPAGKIEIDTINASRHSFALSLAEDVTGPVTDVNVGRIVADRITHAIVRADAGVHDCIVNEVDARDCTTADIAQWPGLLSFNGAGCVDNVVRKFRHRRTGATAAPNKTINQKSGAARNYVEDTQRVSRSLHRQGLRQADSVAETSTIEHATNVATALTSQTAHVSQVMIPAGQRVAVGRAWTGTTALAGGNHQQFALIRISDRQVMAVSADDLATAWPANSEKALAYTAPWWPEEDTNCWFAVWIDATTPPTLLGYDLNSLPAARRNRAPVLGGISDVGKAAPYAVGDTAAAVTSHRLRFWADITA